MPSQPVPYDFKSIIHFGKHKGEVIEDVLYDDPTYLDWAVEYVAGFTLTEAVEKKLYELLDRIDEQDNKYNYINDEFWKD
jgi:hypothetical protein